MAIQQLDIRPQEGFNAVFSKIVNCEIIPPTYNRDYLSQFFFLGKRKGIIQLGEKHGYDFLDYSEKYGMYLTRNLNTNDYEVLDNNFNTILTISGGGKADVFVEVLGGTIQYDTGTATSGSVNSLTDTSKNWTNNELAGYYVYIYDGTGAGQLRYIVSNTSDTINVSGFDVAPGAGSKYRVYKKLDYTLTVPYKNGLYVYDGSNWNDEPIFSGYDIENMIVWNSRLWYTSGNKLYYSAVGDYFNFPLPNQIVLPSYEVNNLYPYGSFLIVGTEKNISVVYKGFSATDGTEFFILKEGVSNIGIKNKFGVVGYQGGLYIIGSDNRMYAVKLHTQGTETILLLEDNGSIPAYFIERYRASEHKLYSDMNNLYIYAYNFVDGKTYELYYNSQYKGWLNNEYNFKVNRKFFLSNVEYVLCREKAGMRGGQKDFGQPYTQHIEMIVGEQDIWNWKNLKYLNLILGKTDYIQNGKVKVVAHIGNKKLEKSFNLSSIGYISDVGDVIGSTIGSGVVGNMLFGGDQSDLWESMSDIDIIQIGVNTTGQIFNIMLDSEENNGLVFGGVYLYYNLLNPKLKYYRNII